MERVNMGGIMERVFPDDWDFGGVENKAAWDESVKIQNELAEKLAPEERKTLDILRDAYIHESNVAIQGAFMRGFFDGMELMMEYYSSRNCPDSSES